MSFKQALGETMEDLPKRTCPDMYFALFSRGRNNLTSLCQSSTNTEALYFTIVPSAEQAAILGTLAL
jgi:hypothetical protein